MPAEIINGLAIAQAFKDDLKAKIRQHYRQGGSRPGLAVILVGHDPASQVYVRNKEKACQESGIVSEIIRLPETVEESDLIDVLNGLNQRKDVHGILVQLPLPKHIPEGRIIETIRPDKDVDGFHPINMGKLIIGEKGLIPCTPLGCMYMLDAIGADVAGKNAVVVGRSNHVGKPMGILLLQRHATVTFCHSRTAHLASITSQADILIVAVGKLQFITADMVKPGAVVLDVGMNRLPDRTMVGDVDFGPVSKIAGALTPVPKGVGPMTVAMLLNNTWEAMKHA
jgi:methylenetetrahydrofolate dehydrogenase (NADP+)/methenyltetrahydrofolate cyclohydrolase